LLSTLQSDFHPNPDLEKNPLKNQVPLFFCGYASFSFFYPPIHFRRELLGAMDNVPVFQGYEKSNSFSFMHSMAHDIGKCPEERRNDGKNEKNRSVRTEKVSENIKKNRISK